MVGPVLTEISIMGKEQGKGPGNECMHSSEGENEADVQHS